MEEFDNKLLFMTIDKVVVQRTGSRFTIFEMEQKSRFMFKSVEKHCFLPCFF